MNMTKLLSLVISLHLATVATVSHARTKVGGGGIVGNGDHDIVIIEDIPENPERDLITVQVYNDGIHACDAIEAHEIYYCYIDEAQRVEMIQKLGYEIK